MDIGRHFLSLILLISFSFCEDICTLTEQSIAACSYINPCDWRNSNLWTNCSNSFPTNRDFALLLIPRSFEIDTVDTDLHLNAFMVGHSEYSMFNNQIWRILNGSLQLSDSYTSYVNASGSLIFDLLNENELSGGPIVVKEYGLLIWISGNMTGDPITVEHLSHMNAFTPPFQIPFKKRDDDEEEANMYLYLEKDIHIHGMFSFQGPGYFFFKENAQILIHNDGQLWFAEAVEIMEYEDSNLHRVVNTGDITIYANATFHVPLVSNGTIHVMSGFYTFGDPVIGRLWLKGNANISALYTHSGGNLYVEGSHTNVYGDFLNTGYTYLTGDIFHFRSNITTTTHFEISLSNEFRSRGNDSVICSHGKILWNSGDINSVIFRLNETANMTVATSTSKSFINSNVFADSGGLLSFTNGADTTSFVNSNITLETQGKMTLYNSLITGDKNSMIYNKEGLVVMYPLPSLIVAIQLINEQALQTHPGSITFTSKISNYGSLEMLGSNIVVTGELLNSMGAAITGVGDIVVNGRFNHTLHSSLIVSQLIVNGQVYFEGNSEISGSTIKVNERGSLTLSQVILDTCEVQIEKGAFLEIFETVILEESSFRNEGTMNGISTINGTIRNDGIIEGMTGNKTTNLWINGHLILGENSRIRVNLQSVEDHTLIHVHGNLTADGKVWIYLHAGLLVEEGTSVDIVSVSQTVMGSFKNIYVVPTSEWDNVNKCKNFTTTWEDSIMRIRFIMCKQASKPNSLKIELIVFPIIALTILIGGSISLFIWKKGYCQKIRFQKLSNEDELDEFKISDN